MARDDRLKKVQEAGADFLENARSRAEEFLRELAKAGDSTQDRAQEAIDDLFSGSRKGTEQILSAIRSEVASQLGLLGLATKADLADLEARVTGATKAKAAPAKKVAAKKVASSRTASTPAASKAARKTTAAKAPAKTAKRTSAKKAAG
jgi:polyhydroxyalkanoate synthesis regulator phasin